MEPNHQTTHEEAIVAYSFESETKTFKYITVEGVKSNNYT